MGNAIFSVGQAAEWLAQPHENKDAVARQLRHYRKRGFIRSRGTFGAGPTATNTFAPTDIGVARLWRALTALGVASEDVRRAVEEACYVLPSNSSDFMGMPGMESALASPHAPWSLFVFLSDQGDGSQRVFAEVFRTDLSTGHPEHPSVDAMIQVPMRWLPSLAELAEQGAR